MAGSGSDATSFYKVVSSIGAAVSDRHVTTSAPLPPAASLLRLKMHYFAVYGVMGCVAPYLSVYLRDVKVLAPAQIGLIYATGQAGVLFMPALMTHLADRHRLVAPLLAGLFAVNAAAVGLLSHAAGFAACLAAVFFVQLANQPQIALGDGLFFSFQRDPRMPTTKYSAVRVWGTLGFIFASVVVAGVFRWDGLELMPAVAVGAAVLGLLNALRLPARLPPLADPASRRLPSVEAARVLLQPRLAVLCLGLGCLVATNAAYYAFYPLYLTDLADIPARWVGIVAAGGVTIEVGWMLAFESLRTRFGLPGMIMLGGCSAVTRLALLAFLPLAGVAVGVQVIHGVTVIGLLISPAMYLNSQAPDHCRNSVQGLYVMLVVGLFAIVGNTLAGMVAEIGLLTLYRTALAVGALGLALVLFSFLWHRPPAPA